MIEPEFLDLEAKLRECAPTLPPALKSRTLTRCAEAKHRRKQRLNWHLKLAVAGVFALQLLALSRLDAQNARLIAGRGAAPTFASISFAEMRLALQERSRQLALLMSPSRIG